MLFLLLFLELTLFLLSNVTALNITVQSNTIVGQPSLVLWERTSSDGDGQLVFDLRFVKPDNEDIGLALANIQAPPSTDSGTVQVVFQSPGSYLLVAVTGYSPDYTTMGQSGQVNAFQVPITSIPSQPVPSATSSAQPVFSSSAAHRKKNLGAIIGGTLGGVAFLGLVAASGIVFLRRRRLEPKEDNRRWTDHRDKMILLSRVIDIRRTTESESPMKPPSLSPDDIEQQVVLPHDDIIPITTSPVIMAPAFPNDPIPLFKSESPQLPLSVLPLKPHQEDKAAQMERIRNKMTELEKNPGPTQHIILDDLQKQMVWLKSQF